VIVDTGTGHRTGFLSDEGGDVAPATATATATAVGPDADTGTVVAGQLVLVQRCAWTLVWVAVLASGLQFWGSWSAGLWAAVLAPLLAALGIAGTVLVWTVRRPLGRTMQVAGLSAALGTVAVTQGTAIHLRHYYATDSAAFDLWAGAVAGAEMVHAEWPFGTLDAQGFSFLDRGTVIQFTGPGRLVLNGHRS